MKKILFINDCIFGGGVENVMHEFVRYLSDKDYDITIFTPCREKKIYNTYPKKVKHTYYYRYAIKSYNIVARILKKLIRAIKGFLLWKEYDIVVAMKEGSSVLEALKYKKTTRRVAWIHTDYKTFRWTEGYFANKTEEKKVFSKFDTTICVTETVKSNLIEAIGDPGNLVVKYNPVNSENIVRKSSENCDLIKPQNKTLFVTVGRFCKEKGYKELLETIGLISDKSKFEMWIIGGGDEKYESQLKKIIKNNNLGNCVKLLGVKDNPFPYVKQADFYLCSSTTESFCIAIQEALILGIPIITTNCPGALELMDPNVGIVVDSMDEMREKLIEIYEDNGLINKYKENVKKYYTCVSANERLEALEKVLL